MTSSESTPDLPEQLLTPEGQSFDYAALNTETRIVVQQCTQEIKSLMRQTAFGIIDIGQKLIDVKQQLGHGHFDAWLRAEFDWGEWTARKFMQVTRQFKTVNFTNLSISTSALYLLASSSTPEEARAEALQYASQGKPITYTKAKSIISKHKEAAKPQSSKQVVINMAAETEERESSAAVEPEPAPQTWQPPKPLETSADVVEAKSMRVAHALQTAETVEDTPANADQSKEELLGKEVEPELPQFEVGDRVHVDDRYNTSPPPQPISINTSNICTTLLSNLQHFTNEQVAAVFGAFAQHIGAEALGNIVTKSIHQDKLADLCNKCLGSMDEQAFSWLEVEKIKFSGLSDLALEFLIKESKRSLNEQHRSEYIKGKNDHNGIAKLTTWTAGSRI